MTTSRPPTRLPVDDARHVGARRANEESAGLDEDRGLAEQSGSRRPAASMRREAARPGPPDRAIRRGPRTGCRARRRRRRGGAGRRRRRASRRAAADRGLDVVAERRRRRGRSRPRTRCSPSRSRCGEIRPRARREATRSRASIPNLPAPLSPTRRTRSSEAAVDTAPRSRIGMPPAARLRRSPRAGRSSLGDSTVTARMPARTAASSSSSRLPGPVITIRSAAIPARSAVASSPADATSAPRPRAAMWATTPRAGFAFTA